MIHPLAAHFGSAADTYELGRPEYPPHVAARLGDELGLDPGARVLDVGAGTGKLTRALLAAGYDVTAVEPSAEMRKRLAGSSPGARIVDAAAERLPFGRGEFAAALAADAFHWFDAEAALAEFQRVLIPRGAVALVNALPDWSSFEAGRAIATLIGEVRPEHPFFDGPGPADALRAAGAWGEPREVVVEATVPGDAERLVAYVGSISFVAGFDPPERARLLDAVAEAASGGGVPPELPFRFRACIGRLA